MATTTAPDVRPVTPVVGATISGVDLREPLGPDTVRAIRQALHGKPCSSTRHGPPASWSCSPPKAPTCSRSCSST
ncbi:hypothetical protein FRAHR75_260059 [Frankia sp. Hr75.2]|nr:hypothetical protein FRAHR75_260059 [Frankia sp. Hr75.2]